MITEEDFSTNDAIDNMKIGDPNVDIVGFVSKVNDNTQSQKGAKFYKFVVDNNTGREVQVVSWNENRHILQKVKELGTIVMITNVKASAVKNRHYNSGNVDFELLVKNNSEVHPFGCFAKCKTMIAEEVQFEQCSTKINKRIKISGAIVTEIRKYENRDFEFNVGAISDGHYKLEIKCDFDNEMLSQIDMGTGVRITGLLERFYPGPAVLKVAKFDDIEIIQGNRVSFAQIMQAAPKQIISA